MINGRSEKKIGRVIPPKIILLKYKEKENKEKEQNSQRILLIVY